VSAKRIIELVRRGLYQLHVIAAAVFCV
jgi:hypothetical protein